MVVLIVLLQGFSVDSVARNGILQEEYAILVEHERACSSAVTSMYSDLYANVLVVQIDKGVFFPGRSIDVIVLVSLVVIGTACLNPLIIRELCGGARDRIILIACDVIFIEPPADSKTSSSQPTRVLPAKSVAWSTG